jgi:hypothetical protein
MDVFSKDYIKILKAIDKKKAAVGEDINQPFNRASRSFKANRNSNLKNLSLKKNLDGAESD